MFLFVYKFKRQLPACCVKSVAKFLPIQGTYGHTDRRGPQQQQQQQQQQQVSAWPCAALPTAHAALHLTTFIASSHVSELNG